MKSLFQFRFDRSQPVRTVKRRRRMSSTPWALLAAASLGLLFANPSRGSEPAEKQTAPAVRDFALLDHRGSFRHLHYHAKDPKTKAIVLFVHGNGCPLVRQRVPQMKQLRDAYADKGVLFWMINANTQDTRDEVSKEASEFGIDMPILLDPTQVVARDLKIVRTAEAI